MSASRALSNGPPDIALEAIARYRLERIQSELALQGIDGAVLYDPINLRYATGSRNMQVWCLHNPVRYAFVPAVGSPLLFEFRNCEHLAKELPLSLEVRPAIAWSFFMAGNNLPNRARAWAHDVVGALREKVGGTARRLAVDRLDPGGLDALRGMGIEVSEAQPIMEVARSIKCAEEIRAMRWAIAISDVGMKRMIEALRPGISENALWALFHANNIEHGGEYIETRLLSSGFRTNPWFQECSDKAIEDGDVVCHDTDMIGPFGFCVDVSRTHYCGAGVPADAKRTAYSLATEQVEFNTALISPGMSFRSYAERAWPVPAQYRSYRYATTVHGVGLSHEWPRVVYSDDWANSGCEGCFQPGMTLCVESYVGSESSDFGIKYTDQIVVTESGIEVLSLFPKDVKLAPI